MKRANHQTIIGVLLKRAGSFLAAGLAASLLFHSTPGIFAASTGGQPAQFLSWGAGARSLGMGGAFNAVSDDASATYWNPAGLAQLDRREVMALHANLFADTSYDFISFVQPTAKYGVFGGNLTRLYSGGFEKIGITYNSSQTDIIDIQNLGTFDDVQMALTGAYGKKINDNVSAGISTKYIMHTLDTSTNGFITFDVGVMAEKVNMKFPDLKLAFGIQNLIYTKFGDTDDKLPIILRVGASHPFLRNKLLVDVDIDKNMAANMEWHLGTEYWLINFACVRVGFNGEQGIRETTAGFGVNIKTMAWITPSPCTTSACRTGFRAPGSSARRYRRTGTRWCVNSCRRAWRPTEKATSCSLSTA
jgi:hypothetical protein